MELHDTFQEEIKNTFLNNSWTALRLALQYGHLDVVKELIKARAVVYYKNLQIYS